MTISVKDSSVWETVENIFCKDGGVWKTVEAAFIKDGGVWKEFYSAVVSLWDDITTAVYTGDSFNTFSQERNTRGLAFNTDGTKMFIIGAFTDRVYEYTLSTAFSISTAAYSGNSFSVAAQETTPVGFAFNNDGTKMFVVGFVNDTIYEYTLSTAFSISTATYSGNSFNVAAQDAGPHGITFNTDGTKMFMVGRDGRRVYEYTLSTAFSISTATYSGNNFSFLSQDSDPHGITFNTDGTKMFMSGITSDTIYEYTLSTAFSISTVSYTGNSFNVAAQTTAPYTIAFNNDGSKMFTGGNTIYEYISA